MLGRSLDELPPQTRRLLLLVDEMVTAECKRQKIERAGIPLLPARRAGGDGLGRLAAEDALGRLEELEYLLVHRGGRGQSFVYELVLRLEATRQAGMPG